MRSVLLLFFVFGYIAAKAQSNAPLEYRIRPDSAKTGSLYLNFHNFNYLRNYEFFNDFQDGYTLFGTQVEPQLVYYAHPRLAIMAGIHARKDFGKEGIYKTYPLFSLKYQWKNTALITGALEGNIHHRYIEPIFDFEHKLTHPVEYGTQLIVQNPGWFLDAWISWKRMIYKPSPEQEQIMGGVSSDIRLAANEKWKISLPLQLLAFHQGGQIDTISKPLQTLVNTAAGFKINYAAKGFVKNIHTENYLAFFNELSPEKIQPFTTGTGILLNGGLDTRWGNLGVSYWKGSGFNSPFGMPLYQSVSQKIRQEGYPKKNRELLFIRYAYQKKLLPHLYLDFRVEPVFLLDNTSSDTMNFYHSMFLVYRQEFRLLKSR